MSSTFIFACDLTDVSATLKLTEQSYDCKMMTIGESFLFSRVLIIFGAQ